MWQFFAGQGGLPEDFNEQYLCHSLNLSKTELDKQPEEWITKMIFYLSVKSEYEDFEYKKKNRKTATKTR